VACEDVPLVSFAALATSLEGSVEEGSVWYWDSRFRFSEVGDVLPPPCSTAPPACDMLSLSPHPRCLRTIARQDICWWGG